ncbi:hypothetical protein [Actinomadura sp. 6N118]|uniref:hypothetical protein n=1 Tax=Actinomadura sp. 6N118 TaxID=3375151 RepID=UPI0037A11B2D
MTVRQPGPDCPRSGGQRPDLTSPGRPSPQARPISVGFSAIATGTPISGGYALRALQRVLTPILDTQGERARKAGRTGSLYSPATGKGSAPAGKPVERAPLRVIELDAGDIAVLDSLATTLEESGRGHEAVVEAAEQHFDAETWETRGDRSPLERLTTAARRLADLLTTPARFTPAEAALIETIAAVPDDQDITLTADQHTAYRSVVTTLNQAALGLFGSGLAQYVALGE